MKGGHPHAADVGAKQRRDAPAHFFGGLVGEGDGEDFVRLRVTVADEVRDPARDDPRFSRSGARKDEQRAADMKNGFALFGVQGVQELHAGTWGLGTGDYVLERS